MMLRPLAWQNQKHLGVICAASPKGPDQQLHAQPAHADFCSGLRVCSWTEPSGDHKVTMYQDYT